jgi:hypothetical protein
MDDLPFVVAHRVVIRAQRLRQFLLLRHIDPGPDEPLEHSGTGHRRADAPYVANRSVGTHNPSREVESAMLCQHGLNFLRDELPIVRVYERQVFRDRWRFAAGVEAINRKQRSGTGPTRRSSGWTELMPNMGAMLSQQKLNPS